MKCNCAKSKALTIARPVEPGCPDESLRELRDGEGLYERFNQSQPAQVIKVNHDRLMPPVVVHLGELVGLMYRAQKGLSRSSRTYVHFMENPPRLVSNVLGTQLYVVGGSYRVSARGIEG